MFTNFEGKENIANDKLIKTIIFPINLHGHKESLTFKKLISEYKAINIVEKFLFGNTLLKDFIYLERIVAHENKEYTYYIQCAYLN